MSVIQEARAALNIDPILLSRVAAKRGIDPQEAGEQIAYRRAVLDRGGRAAAEMAAVILQRPFRGVEFPLAG